MLNAEGIPISGRNLERLQLINMTGFAVGTNPVMEVQISGLKCKDQFQTLTGAVTQRRERQPSHLRWLPQLCDLRRAGQPFGKA